MTRRRPAGPLAATLALIAAFAAPAARADAILYDPGLGTLPDGQGWLYDSQAAPGVSVIRSMGPGNAFTRLDTTAGAARAGYARIDQPLDRAAGYTIRLDLRVAAESHASGDRAGFSLIALSGDRRGIELGFWEDRIWAQEVGFTRAEEVAFATTATTRYDLAILGDSYTLYADGAALLAGALRDYAAFGLPYNVPNFLYLGDNTLSAAASVEIGRVEFLARAVPEPGSLALLAAGGLGLIGTAARRRAARAP